jgi:hypothetical protein
MKDISRTISVFLASLLCLIVFAVAAEARATIQIINLDGAGEGFNDLTPAVPIGGNPGTTLGEQRLFAFNYAASLWARQLDSGLVIRIQAAFNPLGSNVLGSAGTVQIFRDFTPTGLYPGPEFPATWYGGAIADKRAGRDLNQTSNDINTQFNSDFNFYLGVDRNFGTGQYDLVTVLLHELGHGLGFQNFVSRTTGANNGGFTDIYSRYIFDNVVGLYWDQMTDQQRLDSFVRTGSVVWTGANVTANAPRVLSGSPEVRVLDPPNLSGLYQFGTAQFGPPLGPLITGTLVAGLDPSDGNGPSTTDGCSPLTNASQVAGKIAIIDRGTCSFVIKVKNAQDAGAIAVVIQNNTTGLLNMGGVDPSINIPSVLISQADGGAWRAAIPNVVIQLRADQTQLLGTDALGRVRLFAPDPIQQGSSISHFDSVATKNLLMEPSINFDLTHNLRAPDDLTVELMRDIGWFVDSDLDGIENKLDCAPRSDLRQTVFVKGVNSSVTNQMLSNGCTISDRILKLPNRTGTQSEFIRRLTQLLDQLVSQGVINSSQRTAILNAANGSPSVSSQPSRQGK